MGLFAPPPPPPPPPPTLGKHFGFLTADESNVCAGAAAVVIIGLLMASPKARRGLFTHEDSKQIHKLLGFGCLLSYAYRFAKVGERDMGFSASSGTLASIALHMTLSGSSMIFNIPRKRTLTHYRIWPEYRLHSIVFAFRSLLTMLLFWVEALMGIEEPVYPLNTLLVLLCFGASDYASYSVGDAHSKSIRDLDVPPPVQFAFSWIQFHGTYNCILAVRRYSTFFIYVWIVQFNAFVMTVQRKNIFASGPLLCVYGFMLLFGYCVVTYEMVRAGGWTLWAAANAIANAAAILRMSGSWLGGKKYLMWGLIGVFTHFMRGSFFGDDSPHTNTWRGLCALSYCFIGSLAYKKISSKYYAKAEKGGWSGHEAAGEAAKEAAKPAQDELPPLTPRQSEVETKVKAA